MIILDIIGASQCNVSISFDGDVSNNTDIHFMYYLEYF